MRKIFLYGPPGSGKTTVGKILAKNLNIPFHDIDHEVELSEGMPVSEIINSHGLPAFREIESSVINFICSNEIQEVVALGGGALLRDENRLKCENSGNIVFLDTSINFLLPRILQNKEQRPLLSKDPEKQLKTLLEQRKVHYSQFKLRVTISDNNMPEIIKTPEDTAEEIQMVLGQYLVKGMGMGYEVSIKENALLTLDEYLESNGCSEPFALVCDENVASLHLAKVLTSLNKRNYKNSLTVIRPGEEFKTLQTVTGLWRNFLQENLDRKSTVIALGGGVVGDLAGFAASTFMRGCHWVAIPTTLLSMVDASVGGKTGFDLPEGKNLIGTFYPPQMVLADPSTLSTLPDSELISGFAEVIKHGIIGDVELFRKCANSIGELKKDLVNVVKRAVRVKIRIIEDDPLEKGVRASLNFGHTIGHAIEISSNFSLRHGEAVAIGMVYEARLAEKIGIADKGITDQIEEVLFKVGLPNKIPTTLSRTSIIESMKKDKKREKTIVKFALPVRIGEVRTGIEIENLELAL